MNPDFVNANEVKAEQLKKSIFPWSLFWIFFGVMLLMSALHYGLTVLGTVQDWPVPIKIILPLAYWVLVAAGLTIFTRRMMQQTYEKPMLMLAEASSKVAGGDFSVFVPTIHTQDKYDYLDYMILDFNKMVEELGSIETLKTDFFTNVSHEMKTPLAIISNNAELLASNRLDSRKSEECIAAIRDASRRMNSLITNMLKLNKLENQSIKPAPQRYNLCEQLVECVFQYEKLLDKYKLELETDFPDSVFIHADQELMMLVWTNLISNAIKFTPEGGTVSLKVEPLENSVKIHVKDSGCGMSEETLPHIFDKFYQGDRSHATAGNGLGLALVKRILEISDGTIQVESHPGVGSEFIVELPLDKVGA